MKKIGEEKFQLSSGRVFEANRGIIGISDDAQEIGEGYDGHLEAEWFHAEECFTDEEKKEIAEFVIERWRKWASL